jgi:secreted trypsin-like serine protease
MSTEPSHLINSKGGDWIDSASTAGGVFLPLSRCDALCRYVSVSRPGIYEMSSSIVLPPPPPRKERRKDTMAVDKVFRYPLWATLVGALVAAMGVSFLVFVQSGEATPQAAADEQPPYASVSPRIVGGSAVPDGKHPFMVALLDKRKPGGAFQEQFCGGTLIDKDRVLTAAHCLVNPKPDKLQVVIGRTALTQNRGQLRSVSRRFIHPRYKPLASYDAAVLKLGRPVRGIQPIKLATARQNNLENPGHILRAAGWGVVRQRPGPFDAFPVRMHEASVPVVSDSRAKRSYQSLGLKYLPSIHVAAGKKGKGVCFGDSGGPLFDPGSRTQVGITSAGVGCASRIPGIYTEVNNPGIRTWILRAAKR